MAIEGLGVNTIAPTLNREELMGKAGARWHARTVGNLLRNARRNRAKVMDARIWNAISRAVDDPDSLFHLVIAQRSSPSAVSCADDARQSKSRIKELASQEKSLLATLRAAPSPAERMTGELERVARERKALELAQDAKPTQQAGNGRSATTENAIKTFPAAVRERLGSMDTTERLQLLSILGFQTTVTTIGEVQASILVPAEVNPNHHCTNMGMTLIS